MNSVKATSNWSFQLICSRENLEKKVLCYLDSNSSLHSIVNQVKKTFWRKTVFGIVILIKWYRKQNYFFKVLLFRSDGTDVNLFNNVLEEVKKKVFSETFSFFRDQSQNRYFLNELWPADFDDVLTG